MRRLDFSSELLYCSQYHSVVGVIKVVWILWHHYHSQWLSACDRAKMWWLQGTPLTVNRDPKRVLRERLVVLEERKPPAGFTSSIHTQIVLLEHHKPI